MMPRWLILTACVLVLGGGTPSWASTIVYDNTTTPTGFFWVALSPGDSDGFEHGDQVTLAGTDRVITRIEFPFLVAALEAIADGRVRFYQNDGPGGSPGGLIWDSGPLTNILLSNTTLGVAVPGVQVPDTFIWTFQLTNRDSPLEVGLGIILLDPPTVGTSDNQFLWQFDGGWASISAALTGVPMNLGATIMAIPEPATGLLLLTGVLALAAVRGRNRGASDWF